MVNKHELRHLTPEMNAKQPQQKPDNFREPQHVPPPPPPKKLEREWKTSKPPNETLVEVEYKGEIIQVMAFYGRDGYRPHWRNKGGSVHYHVSTFNRWRELAN